MTPHNQASIADIAPVVLMPGDPLRAKYIAETYLENPVLFNQVRGMFGYTGTYKGVPVSVMGSGMGMPSIGIYSYELFSQYNVQAIIRVGSAGAYTADLAVFDVVLASDAYSESTFAKVQNGNEDDIQKPSAELNAVIEETAKKNGIDLHLCRIHSSDVFYHEDDKAQEIALKKGARAVEMESFALFSNARVLNKQAACLLTISDSFVNPETNTTSEQREKSFDTMIRLALESSVVFAKDCIQS